MVLGYHEIKELTPSCALEIKISKLWNSHFLKKYYELIQVNTKNTENSMKYKFNKYRKYKPFHVN